ncbi:hypothetical protein J1N35_005685 [Gossypium stocksii]|uniref:Pentatricopeptide repeat-containing protein n=1 Tax=Gossypium stocksii TaxID=47602 RepID=A0A9D4AJH5_9ROSI|nr:hypothetical protein J1N35_005685 [Gossypium stocksii]
MLSKYRNLEKDTPPLRHSQSNLCACALFCYKLWLLNLIWKFHGLLLMGYSRCAHSELSRLVYETLPVPNVFCFTYIINGYAQNGMGREGVSLLEAMVHKGLMPDEVTSLRVLSGCNHAGLAKEGKLVFNLMKIFYGSCPEL